MTRRHSGGRHLETEAEPGVTCLKPRNAKNYQEPPAPGERRGTHAPSGPPEGARPAHTSVWDFQPPDLCFEPLSL